MLSQSSWWSTKFKSPKGVKHRPTGLEKDSPWSIWVKQCGFLYIVSGDVPERPCIRHWKNQTQLLQPPLRLQQQHAGSRSWLLQGPDPDPLRRDKNMFVWTNHLGGSADPLRFNDNYKFLGKHLAVPLNHHDLATFTHFPKSDITRYHLMVPLSNHDLAIVSQLMLSVPLVIILSESGGGAAQSRQTAV